MCVLQIASRWLAVLAMAAASVAVGGEAPARTVEGRVVQVAPGRLVLESETDPKTREVFALQALDPAGLPVPGSRVRITLRDGVVAGIVERPADITPAKPARVTGRVVATTSADTRVLAAVLVEKEPLAAGADEARDRLAVYRWQAEAPATGSVRVAHWVRAGGLDRPEGAWQPGERHELFLARLAHYPDVAAVLGPQVAAADTNLWVHVVPPSAGRR